MPAGRGCAGATMRAKPAMLLPKSKTYAVVPPPPPLRASAVTLVGAISSVAAMGGARSSENCDASSDAPAYACAGCHASGPMVGLLAGVSQSGVPSRASTISPW